MSNAADMSWGVTDMVLFPAFQRYYNSATGSEGKKQICISVEVRHIS